MLKYHLKRIIKQQDYSKKDFFYSTECIKNIYCYNKTDGFNKALFLSFDSIPKAIKSLKSQTSNNEAKVALSCLYLAQNNKDDAFLLFDDIDSSKLSKYWLGQFFYLRALLAMKHGDLLPATTDIQMSINIFASTKSYYEEAKATLLFAEICKFSTLYDVAELYYRNALKIFEYLNSYTDRAYALGSLGMLMVLEERNEEALEYFKQAIEHYTTVDNKSGIGNILNQQALLYISQNKTNEALVDLAQAIKMNKNNKNGLGLSYDLRCYCYANMGDYNNVIIHAQTAIDLYSKSKNMGAKHEAMYQKSLAYHKLNAVVEAEQLLRLIIEQHNNDSNSAFYIANVYNLLGIIYLDKKDYSRAKGLFNQSIFYEQQGCRQNALALDYMNIALIEQELGDKEQSVVSLGKALDCAKSGEDAELCLVIEDRLKLYQQ